MPSASRDAQGITEDEDEEAHKVKSRAWRSKGDAEHLEYLLKKYYKKALLKGDSVLAKRLSYILIGLDGYLAGEISEDDYKRLSNVR